MTPQSMTTADVERMREFLAQHDQKNGGKQNKEFDLADPPRSISSGGTQQDGQYRAQKYPMSMTKVRAGKPSIVKSAHGAAEVEQLEAKGYLDPEAYRAHVASLPPAMDPDDDDEDEDIDEDEVRAQIAAASGEFDPNAVPKKNKGGRPRKVQLAA